MNKISAFLAIGFISSIFFLSSCNETSNIGDSIIEQDLVNSEYIDTISLEMKTVESEEELITYFLLSTGQVHSGRLLFGNFDDPIFGQTKSDVYTTVKAPGIDPGRPSLDLVIDSIILQLPYHNTEIYGNFDDPIDIKVYKLADTIPSSDLVYTNQTVELGEEVGSASVSNLMDSVVVEGVYPPVDTIESLSTFPPHLRIPLSLDFADELLKLGSDEFTNQDEFADKIKGLYIEATNSNKGILSLDLSSVPSSAEFQPSNFFDTLVYPKDIFPDSIYGLVDYAPQITIFYQDTTYKSLSFPLDGFAVPRFSNISNNYEGSFVEEYIENEELNKEYNFVQGHTGLRTEVNIPYTEGFEDLSIIKAELEVTVYYFPEDSEEDYPPIIGLVLEREPLEGEIDTSNIVIDDALFAAANQNLSGLFGGNSAEVLDDETGMIIQTYKLNIAAHLNKLRDELVDNKMILTVYSGQLRTEQRSGRAVICGPEHPDYPAKINLYYSK